MMTHSQTLTARFSTALSTGLSVGRTAALATLVTSPVFAGGGGDNILRDHTINAVVFVALVIIAVRKPIAEALNSRADSITKEIQEAQEALAKAEDALNTYEGMISDLESEREHLLAQYREQGEREKQDLIDEGKREADRLAADAERAVENQLAALQHKIEAELVDVAMSKAEAMIIESVKAQDHKRLTEDYIKQLGNLA